MQLHTKFVNFAAAQKQVLDNQISRRVFAVVVGVVPTFGELVVGKNSTFGQMLAGFDERLVGGVAVHVFSDFRIVKTAVFVGDIPIADFVSEAFADFFEITVGRNFAHLRCLFNPVGEAPLGVEPRKAVHSGSEVELAAHFEHFCGRGAVPHKGRVLFEAVLTGLRFVEFPECGYCRAYLYCRCA